MRDRFVEMINQRIDNKTWTVSDLADYLLANGVIVPPCKVGDIVYVGIKGTSCVFETKVLAIGIDEDGDIVLNPNDYPDDVFCIYGANIGRTVFLTREEAERALKGEKQ